MAANPFVSLLKWVSGSKTPGPNDDYIPIRALPQKKTRFGFGRVIAGAVDPSFGALVAPLGVGMTLNQATGNLVLTSGTTINQDGIIRSAFSVTDPYTLRWSTVLSQRIAQQQYIIELVDVIGDALPCTILSATSVRVTLPAGKLAERGWDARNYGQTVSLGNYAGSGTFAPINAQAATITNITGNDVTFTVAAGGLAAGSGTVSMFGWNYHRFVYDSTSATQIRYQSQRNGWPGTAVTTTINSTAGAGHVGSLNVEDNIASFADALRASTATIQNTIRGSGMQDMPPNDTPLFLQIRMLNSTTAPASSTTWTIAFVDIDNYVPQQVSLTSVRSQSFNSGVPVILLGGSTTASQAVTANPGTTAYFVQSFATQNGVTATANTTGVVIKTTAGQIYELTVSNNQSTGFWLKLYNKATAPTVGTDVPIAIIWCPPNALTAINFGPWGKRFALGIGIGITANQAIADTTAPVAGAPVSITYS